MARLQCYPRDNPDALWMYCPSYAAAIAFCVLFGITTLAHLIQAVAHKKPFAWVLIMGAFWETGGYALRILAVIDQRNDNYQTYQQLLIILVPLWINAFCYMCLGRMMHCFLPPKEDQIFGVRARIIAKTFVWGDMFAFTIQLTGGLLSNQEYGDKILNAGLKTYMAGVGVQLLFIALFIAIALRFHLTIRRAGIYVTLRDDICLTNVNRSRRSSDNSRSHLPWRGQDYRDHGTQSSRRVEILLYALYIVLGLIIFRNLYRLIEFSAGLESSITTHEWYTFVFDSVPMLLTFVIFHLFHPGRFLHGPRADFSEENREIKAAKKERKRKRKEDKKIAKQEKKATKQEEKRMEKRQKQGRKARKQ